MQHVITDHIGVWTGAYTAKSSVGRGSSGKLNLHGIKKLRELILELAVRGKLVPQDPNDEPASVLLERIAAEKARLVAEGKIKKQKPLPPITDDEKPFELPSSWEWCKLGEMLPEFQNGASSRGDKEGVDTIVLRLADIKNWRISLDDPRSLLIEKKSVDKYSLKRGDTLIIRVNGSADIVGRFVVSKDDYDAIYCDHFIRLRFQCHVFSTEFFELIGASQLIRKAIEQLFISTAGQKTVNQKHICSLMVVLPPLAEQHRIVTKVNELMALCDQLEQQQTDAIAAHATLVETLLTTLTNSTNTEETTENWNRIAEHFDTLFTTEHSIDQLKQTILQLAVMGKLVAQNPADEPASVLLSRIADEKTRLVKEGKIKKQKPLPPINDDEKPFGLPSGWEWCRLANTGYDLGGGTPSKSKNEFWNGDIPWVSPKDMKTDYIANTVDSVTEQALKETTIKLIPTGSLLMVVRGMILAHSFPVALTKRPVTINQDMKALVYSELKPEFFLLLMKGLKEDLVALVDRSTHGTCKLVSEKLWLKVLAIPPYKEQHRIVTKVNELTTLCNQLKTRIQQTQQTNLHLADAVVERALG